MKKKNLQTQLAIALINQTEATNILIFIKNLISRLKALGNLLKETLIYKTIVNDVYFEESYMLQFEGGALELNVFSNTITNTQTVKQFAVFS